jgi:ABC-type lipoprotein export system ATPase subunit
MGALDWAHGRSVVELLCSTWRARNTALIIVTHDARIISCVDQVLHMDDGRIVESPADAKS